VTTSSWTRVLDDCDARIDAATAALDRGAPVDVPPFGPIEAPGPMPAELVDRARELVERTDALEHRLEDERARVRSELRRLPRMPAAEREIHFEVRA
jgi:hypothetical protein